MSTFVSIKMFFVIKKRSQIINNLIALSVQSLQENLPSRIQENLPSRIDLSTARSIGKASVCDFPVTTLTLGY